MTEFRLKLAFAVALVALDAGWIVWGGYGFDLRSLFTCLGVMALTGLIGFVYTRIRPDERLATMGTETAFLIIYSAAACVLSYLVTTLDFPLIDTVLARTDVALGFQWHDYVAFANAHAWIGVLSSLLYQSTLPQIALSVVLLTMLGMPDRTREMIFIVMVSSFLCVAVSGLLPSEGALAYYHPDAAFYMQNHPVVTLGYKQVFFDLRAGLVHRLSLEDLHGLVAFPSYHVGLSMILVIAFRGVKGWFWPILILNTLVMLSTPIDGGHHLSDGLGGIALALVSAAGVIWLRKRLPRGRAFAVPAQENYGELAGQKA